MGSKEDISHLVGNWNYPTDMRFGVGRIAELPALCRAQGMQRPLIVTDQGLADVGFVKDIIDNCRQNDLGAELFSDVKSNPTGGNINAGVEVYRSGKHDGVIALGGGSGLDAGKAIALMAGQSRPIWDFEDVGDNWTRVNVDGLAPVIAVPTTSGTGSEVGRASVILDETVQIKKIIFHPGMLPELVLADPALTKGLPAPVTAATGLDAFVHCLEAWCAPGYHPMADGIALEGMRLIKKWLPVAVKEADNLTARSHMMVASSMGAAAFQKGLGGVHALAHPLGALYDKHHGLLNAILLPYVLNRNKSAITKPIKRLANYLKINTPGFDTFMEWVLDFRDKLGIPNDLGAIGIGFEQSQKIGEMAFADPSAGGNPISLTPEEYEDIFRAAVNGDL